MKWASGSSSSSASARSSAARARVRRSAGGASCAGRRQRRPRRRESRIERDRALELHERLGQLAVASELSAAQIGFVGLRSRGAARPSVPGSSFEREAARIVSPSSICSRSRSTDSRWNALAQTCDWSVAADELGHHAHLALDPADAALEQIVRAERVRRSRRCPARAPGTSSPSARDHAEARAVLPAELRDQLLGQRVAEVEILRAAAEEIEGRTARTGRGAAATHAEPRSRQPRRAAPPRPGDPPP